MNQSDSSQTSCNLLKAREKSRLQDAIGFGFASHCLENILMTILRLFRKLYLY